MTEVQVIEQVAVQPPAFELWSGTSSRDVTWTELAEAEEGQSWSSPDHGDIAWERAAVVWRKQNHVVLLHTGKDQYGELFSRLVGYRL